MARIENQLFCDFPEGADDESIRSMLLKDKRVEAAYFKPADEPPAMP